MIILVGLCFWIHEYKQEKKNCKLCYVETEAKNFKFRKVLSSERMSIDKLC
jgi:hypothetical protein